MTSVPRVDLVPLFATEDLARFYDCHEDMHGKLAWQKPQSVLKMLGEIKQHMWLFESGENVCPSTRLSHLVHIAGLATILSAQMYCNPEADDRHLQQRDPRYAMHAGLFMKHFSRGFVPHKNPTALFTFSRDDQVDVRAILNSCGMHHTLVIYHEDCSALIVFLKMIQIQVVVTGDSEVWSYLKRQDVPTVLITDDRDLHGIPSVHASIEDVPCLNPR